MHRSIQCLKAHTVGWLIGSFLSLGPRPSIHPSIHSSVPLPSSSFLSRPRERADIVVASFLSSQVLRQIHRDKARTVINREALVSIRPVVGRTEACLHLELFDTVSWRPFSPSTTLRVSAKSPLANQSLPLQLTLLPPEAPEQGVGAQTLGDPAFGNRTLQYIGRDPGKTLRIPRYYPAPRPK
ncbi:hypothetical protein LX36DRAFT_168494 [Colletotrichum falcatum]|nr:hypothetical protein LX36DRAFT_168494 [Colletotrichum falcatum]